MSEHEQEVEVKFYLSNLPAFEQRLKYAGAELLQARVHEINLRYDTPDGALSRAYRVLRLRLDQCATMTYKGPAEANQPVSVRQEIEIEISNFTAASHLLEALGYKMVVMYEKQRTTYTLNNVRVTLDELPFGNFTELEGPDAQTIQDLANILDLDWEARSVESYLSLFKHIREVRHLSVQNLSFDEFQGIAITTEDLGVRPADLQHLNRPLA
jgi:adenylate cyclase, class 2